MHGAWDALTGTNAPMFDQGWGDKSKRWSTHGCVNTYAELGVPLSQMNIGLPFYGRSYRTATGMKQFHDGVDDLNYHLDEGSPQYFNIVNQLSRMKTYRHQKTQTQFAVFNDGSRGVVSYDDAKAICDKVHYANQRGMHGCKYICALLFVSCWLDFCMRIRLYSHVSFIHLLSSIKTHCEQSSYGKYRVI